MKNKGLIGEGMYTTNKDNKESSDMFYRLLRDNVRKISPERAENVLIGAKCIHKKTGKILGRVASFDYHNVIIITTDGYIYPMDMYGFNKYFELVD